MVVLVDAGTGVGVAIVEVLPLPLPLTRGCSPALSSVGGAVTGSPCLDDVKDAVEAVETVGAGDGRASLLGGGVDDPAWACAVAMFISCIVYRSVGRSAISARCGPVDSTRWLAAVQCACVRLPWRGKHHSSSRAGSSELRSVIDRVGLVSRSLADRCRC